MKKRKAVACLLATGLLLGLAASGVAQTSRRESANSYLERGNQWLKKGEVKKAIEDYSFALSFDPRLDQAMESGGRWTASTAAAGRRRPLAVLEAIARRAWWGLAHVAGAPSR